MPSVSAKQARTMAAAAHDPAFARKVGIPTKVAKEFNRADSEKGGFYGAAKRKRSGSRAGNGPGIGGATGGGAAGG